VRLHGGPGDVGILGPDGDPDDIVLVVAVVEGAADEVLDAL
jgi:hypothetical protein